MHWLIPSVSHTISGLGAFAAGTVTPAGLVVSFALAASQSTHLWPIFYGLFVFFFFAGTCATAVSRSFSSRNSNNDRPTKPPTTGRTAANLLANILLVAALVPLHQYYMKLRLATVPWFHSMRVPAGCLPVPSRTLKDEFQKSYTFVDALGNQLPFGIMASYALAMANIFSSSLGARSAAGRQKGGNMYAAILGAFLVSLVAAYGSPMCDGEVEGAQEVMMHVDRSTAWEERTDMTWSWEARYWYLVGCITIIGTVGAALIDRLVIVKRSASIAPAKAGKNMAPSPKEKNANEAAEQALENEGSWYSVIVERRDVVSLGIHVVITSAVILGMASWSAFYWEVE